VHNFSPDEFREALERNGLKVEKIIGKVCTLPLRFPSKSYSSSARALEIV